MASRSAMLPPVMACSMNSCSSGNKLRWEVSGAAVYPAGEGSTPCNQEWPSISVRDARLAGSLCSIREIKLTGKRENERERMRRDCYSFFTRAEREHQTWPYVGGKRNKKYPIFTNRLDFVTLHHSCLHLTSFRSHSSCNFHTFLF